MSRVVDAPANLELEDQADETHFQEIDELANFAIAAADIKKSVVLVRASTGHHLLDRYPVFRSLHCCHCTAFSFRVCAF